MDIARTQGEIAKANALKDPNAIQAAKEVLAGKGILNPTQEQVNNQVSTTAMAPYGTGSDLQRALQAATALTQGLAGGNLQQAAAGAASPYVAGIIHDMTTNADGSVNIAANAMAHAVWGAVASQASGNSALAGATGAAGGELMARYIAGEMYPGVRPEDLSEEQKQTLSALGTLAAGLAGGLTGDSSADAVAGAQAGQNAINNNLIGGSDEGQTPFVQEHGKDVLSCSDAPDSASCQRGKAVNDAIALALGAGAAGGAVIAITPEIIAAAQAGASSCITNPLLCANEISIWVAEMAAGDALPAGLTVATVSKLSIGELSELKALIAVEKQTGKKVSADVVEQLVTTKGATANSGAINNVSINQGQQNKHIPGTNEYKIASDAGLNKSTITASSEVLLQKVGSGQQVGNVAVGTPGSKERINYGQVIGNYIDPQTGISTPTTNGIVHYGKNGVHIVPARP